MGSEWQNLADAVNQAFAGLARAMRECLTPYVRRMVRLIGGRYPLPSPSQPRTLHLALKANARPVLNHRAARREWRKQGRG